MKYTNYNSISKNNASDSYIPEELHQAQQIGIKTLSKDMYDHWDDWVSTELQLNKSILFTNFSADQIDAIGLAIYNIQKNNGFIIADETGKGKGRILAGIARYSALKNIPVIFFTERHHLFSDFWRDILNTNSEQVIKEPFILHKKGKIYSSDGKLLYKSSSKQVEDALKNGIPQNTNLVITTYSQISLLNNKKTKLDVLKKYLKKGIILLDESHNATGESNTQEFLQSLIDESKSTIYSSATFIKNEKEIALYSKAISIETFDSKLLSTIFSDNDNHLLRKYLTYELTKQLRFWRREHEPMPTEWEHIVSTDPDIEKYSTLFADFMAEIFETFRLIQKDALLQNIILPNIWYNSGATINRLSRNLIIILKLNTLIKNIKNSLAIAHKAVVVIDSTFSSLINNIIEDREENNDFTEEETTDNHVDDNKVINLNFSDALIWFTNKTIKQYINNNIKNINIFTKLEKIKNIAQEFSSLPISPIDEIKHLLKKESINCGEISGRNFCLEYLQNGKKISAIPEIARNLIVNSFNNGELDVVILTRAGASGISLHSAKEFEDQRVRDLYELEITNRPTFRLQFIGRVRRKNQVNEPNFKTISTNLPFEKRIVSTESLKLKKMHSHISGHDSKFDNDNIINFYTPIADYLAKQFLTDNNDLAYKLGINTTIEKDDYYYIDSLLKRCIILTPEIQEMIFDYIQYGITTYNNITKNNQHNLNDIKITKIKGFWNQMETEQKASMSKEHELYQNQEKFLNQLKYNWVGYLEGITEYKTETLLAHHLEKILINNKKNSKFKTTFQHIVSFYKKKIVHNQYDDHGIAIIKNNIMSFLKINLGCYIKFSFHYENVYGYIENIEVPPNAFLQKFPTHYLVTIRTINPTKNPNIGIINSTIKTSMADLIECNDLVIYQNTDINWDNFERIKTTIEKKHYFFVGNPFWVHYLKKAYNIGQSFNISINKNTYLALQLTNNWNPEYIKNIRKPIYGVKYIMDQLIGQKIHNLYGNYDPLDDELIKIEHTTGGYNLLVDFSIVKNKLIFDYPIQHKLVGLKQYKHYNLYFIPYKQMRSILGMLEKRGITWFI